VTDAAGNLNQYAYDTENNLLSITDANGHSTSFTYDVYGRVTQTTFPSSLAESYSYDAIGNLLSKTDRKGQTISYVYDAVNRLSRKGYPDSTGVDYIYDLVGKIQHVNDPTGSYGFAYDNMGRLIGATTSYSFLPGQTFSNAYAYDANSNRTSYTAPDGSTNNYTYDTLSRLSTLTNSWAGAFNLGYDGLSRRTSLGRPNGVNTSYQYDSLSRLLSVLHNGANDGANYGYDAAGNRTSKQNLLSGVTSNYTYDPIYELTQVTQAANTTESYSYDPAGNRLSSLGLNSWNVNPSNQLLSTPAATFTYDNNGNMLSKASSSGTSNYSWDLENRLSAVNLPANGGTVSFAYDPFGRRIQKTTASGSTIYLYDGANVVAEYNSAGAVVASYAQGAGIDEPLAMRRGGYTAYYHADGLGSVTSLSGSTGQPVATYVYDSFGNTTPTEGIFNPYRYTAREQDSETGLYYYRARYYDPTIGRFLSEDPIGFGGGINRYSYVENSPTGSLDPLGLCKVVARFRQLGSVSTKLGTLTWDHSYVLTVDENGVNYFGAFPTGNGPSSGSTGGLSSGSSGSSSHRSSDPCGSNKGTSSGNPFGTLKARTGAYTPDIAATDYTDANTTTALLADTPGSCDVLNLGLQGAKESINNLNLGYDPFYNNSNAAAFSALQYLGIDYETPPVRAPGWGHNLIK